MNYFGMRLKYLRKQDHLTQSELAKALGFSKSTISMYENGNREPDFETIETIADYFNVNMSTFFPDGETPDHEKAPAPKDEHAIDIVDDDLREYLDMLRNRSDMRMLFSVTKGATKEQIESIVKLIEAMQQNEIH